MGNIAERNTKARQKVGRAIALVSVMRQSATSTSLLQGTASKAPGPSLIMINFSLITPDSLD